jgi:hypothetical protein
MGRGVTPLDGIARALAKLSACPPRQNGCLFSFLSATRAEYSSTTSFGPEKNSRWWTKIFMHAHRSSQDEADDVACDIRFPAAIPGNQSD